MFTKIILLAGLVATAFAFPQHGGHAVSHQTIHLAAPAAHGLAYAAAPAVAYHAAPALTYHAAPAVAVKAAPVLKAVEVEHYAPPHYEFEYAVHDPHTGDIKEQKESRKDDVVQGYYSLHEPDGTRRIVHYTADKHNGFNAVVQREGKAVHAQPVAIKAAPALIKAAPIAVKAAPVISYAAPLAAHGYSHY